MHTTVSAKLLKRRTKSNGLTTVGPKDHGRRMSLERFSCANVESGYLYELAGGVIEVTDIPDILHHRIVRRLNQIITLYEVAHPNVIESVGGGAEAKIEMWAGESERHPDLSIYLTPPPEDVKQPWDRWMPNIVVEVVSDSSAKRDYEDKRRDYLAAGIDEYWIIDPRDASALFLVRRADGWIEKRLTRRGKWRTRLLPGFVLELSKVFEPSRRRK